MEMREYLYPTGHFTVVYLVAKSLIWSKAESNLVVVETSVKHNNKAIYLWKAARFVSQQGHP